MKTDSAMTKRAGSTSVAPDDSGEGVLSVDEMRSRVVEFLTSGSNELTQPERDEFRGRTDLTDGEISSALGVYSFAIAGAAKLSPEDVNRLSDALSA